LSVHTCFAIVLVYYPELARAVFQAELAPLIDDIFA